jgi:hypothetical protein
MYRMSFFKHIALIMHSFQEWYTLTFNQEPWLSRILSYHWSYLQRTKCREPIDSQDFLE